MGITLQSKLMLVVFFCALLSACTRGHLEYKDKNGVLKEACHTEYTWLPSVDKYAVEYVLVYCAQKAQEKGYTVLNQKLLNVDIRVPSPGRDRKWTHNYAKSEHASGNLSDRQYGYIIAFIDLELNSSDYSSDK
ncbi:hypothetical protein KO520_05475 [Psychrosphaera sp. I2R16]|uniref:hypothetical protein n=1 Tax=Psychrosphaera sp. I2R16 TaxID=2841558 RepID=UPI001C099943|nr:hypothetical protein [Psychrosphaera sp. I2R16]MBU2881412.1 hypothetical protein [Psychrosphaera sp. I2R16]